MSLLTYSIRVGIAGLVAAGILLSGLTSTAQPVVSCSNLEATQTAAQNQLEDTRKALAQLVAELDELQSALSAELNPTKYRAIVGKIPTKEKEIESQEILITLRDDAFLASRENYNDNCANDG
ncbi:MAG: hypothetical protein H8E30_11875 [Alphaproteobacteria bacterium]|nr:hypothetical protein [Alphaproteobacteria bacterium]